MLNIVKQLLNSNSLKGRVVKSSAILTFAGGLENTARLVRNMIIARVLVPEEFGIMAIILAVNWAFSAFTYVGIQQCIIQNKRGAEEDFLNTAWWFSSLLALLMFGFAFVSAPFIARFYDQPELLLMVRVTCLTILLDGMMSPRTYVLEKKLKFSRLVVIMQGSGLVNVLVAITLAYYMKDVWALVIALMFESSFRLLFSFILCPFTPKFKIDHHSMSEIYKFAKGIIGLPIALMIFQQVDVFFLGKMLPMEEVGKYSLVLILSKLPYLIFQSSLSKVMVPVFSELQDDVIKFKDYLISITRIICLFGIPLVVFLSIYAESILLLAYGHNYALLAPTFVVLTISFFVKILNEVMASSFIALAKPELYRSYSLIRLLIVLILLYPFIKLFSLVGAAFSILAAAMVFWLLLLRKLSHVVQLDTRQYIYLIIKGLSVSFLILISGMLLNNLDNKSDILSVSIGILICCITWGIIAFRLMNKSNKLKIA